MTIDVNSIKRRIASSPFSKPAHSSPTLPIKNIFRSLILYRDEFENVSNFTNEKLINAMTPSFQRENTKWSREMQVSFIENIISGFRSEIMLYYVSTQDAGYCNILDGLQRITSIKDFTNNEFPIFGGVYCEELFSIKGLGVGRSDITVKIYEFKDHFAACEHYIAMNKNITHSPSDLIPAYKFISTRNK